MAIRQLGDTSDIPDNSPVSLVKSTFKGSAKDWSVVYTRATGRLWSSDVYQQLMKAHLEAEAVLWKAEREAAAASKPVVEEWR